MTPANRARARPGAVADAIILPNANSELVFSKTNQLIAIRLNPKPISEMIFPRKKSKNVGFLRSVYI
jgi:hypothetical protein